MRVTPVVMAICLILAAPAQIQAASASKDFPNVACAGASNIPTGGYGQVTLKLKWKSGGGPPTQLNSIATYDVANGGCQTGSLVATNAAQALCDSCKALAGCTISGSVAGGAFCGAAVPANLDCCAAGNIVEGDTATLNMTTANGRVVVFKSSSGLNPGETGSVVANDTLQSGTTPASVLTNFLHSTNAGNMVAVDLLPNFVMVIARAGGADGTVTVQIDRGLPPPMETFSFSTTGMDDLALLRALRDGFSGKSIPSNIVDGHALEGLSEASESYYGHALRVTLPPGVIKVHVQAPVGFVNQNDTSITPGPRTKTPALSTWGVAALIGLMLLAGAWILRRTTTMRVNPS